MTTRPKIRVPTQVFHVGDKVFFCLVNQIVQGIVTEDRGPIAAGARSLYQVRVNLPSNEIMVFEIPEDELSYRSNDLKNAHYPPGF